jgi:hypothetical protein
MKSNSIKKKLLAGVLCNILFFFFFVCSLHVLSFGISEAEGATEEVIDELKVLNIGWQCQGDMAGVWIDVDHDGTDDTQVVVATLTGEASPDSWGWFFSFIDSHCGGSYPYTGRGRLKIHFIDMLASGFVWNNPSTWTYKRMQYVKAVTSHDQCRNESSNPYLGVQAYRDLGQTNPISGTTSGTNFNHHIFEDSIGIKEMFISTDFCESLITSLIIGDDSTDQGDDSADQEDDSTQPSTNINIGDNWRYKKGYSNPASGWNGSIIEFDPVGWLEGPTGIGYGDGDDATELSDMRGNYKTVYARKTFNVCDRFAVTGMTLSIDYDDGFVAYINGQEVARANMPDGTPDYNTSAISGHEAGTPVEFDLSAYISNLMTGTNVLAIEGHNAGLGSSDFSLIPELEIEINCTGGGGGGGQNDFSPPATPTNLQAAAISTSQIDLSWYASTDDVGVAGYRIYSNGTLIGTTSSTSYQVTGLSYSTTYSYTVSAYDSAGNESSQSEAASATTKSTSEITSLWQVNNAKSGESSRLYARVKNNLASALPGDARVWFYVSGPGFSSYVGSSLVADLAGGEARWYNVDWSIPGDAQAGTYNYRAMVWSPSSNPKNISPWSSAQAFTVTGNSSAEITRLWGVYYAQCGQSSRLWASVKNSGDSALPGDARVWFYVSGPGFSGYVGSASVANMAAEDVQWYSTNWPIPDEIEAGTYTYWARVWSSSSDPKDISSWSSAQTFTVNCQ